MRGNKQVLSIFMYLIGVSCFSQSGNYKYWNQSPLTWDDFYASPPDTGIVQSNFDYRIGIRYEKKVVSDTNLIQTEVYAYMFKKNSWVKDEAKSTQFLAYHQLLLNMLEITRRKIQEIYYTVDDPYTADSLFEGFSREYANKQTSFSEAYFTSKNKDSLLTATTRDLNRSLEKKENSEIPIHETSKFGYGINAALGYVSFNNSLGNKFNNSPLVNLGFNLSYGKFVAGFNGYLGWNKVKNTFKDTREWEKGLHVGTVAVDMSFGYAISISNIVITPFGGVAFFQIAPTSNLNATSGYTIGGGTFTTGVALDYKLKKSVRLIPGSLFYNRVYSEMNIRFKVAYLPLDFKNDFQSNSILFTIGISTISKVIHVK